jgi:hypothetical protein
LYGETSATIWAENVTTTGTIDKVWAVITPPGEAENPPGVPVTDLPSMDLVYNGGAGRYEGTYNDLSIYGTYEIVVYAMDTEGAISVPKTTRVTQEIGPDVFEDDDTFGEAGVITLDDTEAQRHTFHDQGDQDWVMFYGIGGQTYEIKTGNLGTGCDTVITLYSQNGTTPITTRDDGLYGEDELLSWQCPADGVYYVMVKQYNPSDFGQNTRYDLRVYHPTGAWAGKLLGRVVDALDNGIGGAVVKTDIGNAAAITLPNGYYMLILPSGTYEITITAEGYKPQTKSDVVVTDLNAATLNIKMSSTSQAKKGDINGDGDVNLTDLIVVLRVVAGIDASGLVRSDYAESDADVNGDSKVGMDELLYIMQVVAGLR